MENGMAGALAGLAVDAVLFPLDTIKTRLMSKEATKHWTRVYDGLLPAISCSMPSAFLFFTAYEETKFWTSSALVAACAGEAAACLVRVPCDAVKQRRQSGSSQNLVDAIQKGRRNGRFGLYTGYMATLSREIPFCGIQMSLYEELKHRFGADPCRCCLYGFVSGGTAGALTTPLDVARTRMMLGESSSSVRCTVQTILREEGVGALFSGVAARTAMISIGGLVFLGSYEYAKSALRAVSFKL